MRDNTLCIHKTYSYNYYSETSMNKKIIMDNKIRILMCCNKYQDKST